MQVAAPDHGVLARALNVPFYAGTSIACADTTCWTAGLSGNSPYPAEFAMVDSGKPAGSAVTDRALTVPSPAAYPAITARGTGFAAVGGSAKREPRVSEIVTD
jgi:hypothetical protein